MSVSRIAGRGIPAQKAPSLPSKAELGKALDKVLYSGHASQRLVESSALKDGMPFVKEMDRLGALFGDDRIDGPYWVACQGQRFMACELLTESEEMLIRLFARRNGEVVAEIHERQAPPIL